MRYGLSVSAPDRTDAHGGQRPPVPSQLNWWSGYQRTHLAWQGTGRMGNGSVLPGLRPVTDDSQLTPRSQEVTGRMAVRKGSAATGGARHFLTGLYECRNTLTLVQQSSRDVWGEHQVWSQANESNYFWESYIFIRLHNRPSNRSKCRFIFNQRTIAFIMRDIKGEN